MGGDPCRKSGHRTLAQESDWHCVSSRGRPALLVFYETTLFPQNLATAAAREWLSNRIAYRRPLACGGDAPQPSLLRLDSKERPRLVPRILVVLFHKRTAPAFSEPKIPARLQHGSAPIFLAVPLPMALSLERVPAGDRKVVFQTCGSRWTSETSGPLLDGLHSRFLHVLNHSGVLLDAVLSGSGSPAWLSNGNGI